MTRRKVITEAEAWSAPESSATLMAAIGDRIGPDQRDLSPWFAQYRKHHQSRLAADLQMVDQHASSGARVLEYGAVPLLMTAALSERGYRVSAVDLAPERFSESIRALRLDVRKCDIETESVPFADREFDLVLFNELFEHLRIDPIFTLAEAGRVLKPGGTLLLSTPNLRSFRGLRNLLLRNQGHACSGGIYQQYEKLKRLGHMGHVREYTTGEVSDFLERTGLEIDKIVFRGGHGSGLVGLAERAAPHLRPFFSIVARRPIGPTTDSSLP